jgi:micrococcal nuclease
VTAARRIVVAALVVALAACTSTASPSGPSAISGPTASHGSARVDGVVTRVVDGDTAHIEVDGRDLDVRFIGIDTPETVAPGQPIECYGPQASEYTHRRLDGERVALEYDVEREDRYGRALAYVWLGDELFNETLVRQGYAVVTTFPPDVAYVDRFVAAQRDARENDRGLWGACA